MPTYSVMNNLEKGYLLATIEEGFRVFGLNQVTQSTEAASIEADVNTALDEFGKPARVVLDLRNLKVSFSDLVQGLGATRSERSMFRHPNAAEYIIVTQSRLLKMGSEALGQVQYGSMRVRVLDSMEDALRHAEVPVA